MFGGIRDRVSRIFESSAENRHYGTRRADCWWEPIFNPDLQGKLVKGSWDFSQTAGPLGKYFLGADLKNLVKKAEQHEIREIKFIDCDFQGKFDPETIVMFDECTFVRCDFAYSDWKDTHFRLCTFESCSISLASFSRCQFRDNTWISLGFSGSKTEFHNCQITNPAELVGAGVSRTRKSDKPRRLKLYQWYRLQGTKAHLSRTLMLSHESTGDEQNFFEIARTHDLQQSFAKIAKAVFNLIFSEEQGRIRSLLQLMFGVIENLLIRFFGAINGWGISTLRPLSSLVVIYVAFAFFYYYGDYASLERAFQKSFNITILAGYSNEYSPDMSGNLVWIQNVQAIVSIVVYTVFFGTVLSKVSRAR